MRDAGLYRSLRARGDLQNAAKVAGCTIDQVRQDVFATRCDPPPPEPPLPRPEKTPTKPAPRRLSVSKRWGGSKPMLSDNEADALLASIRAFQRAYEMSTNRMAELAGLSQATLNMSIVKGRFSETTRDAVRDLMSTYNGTAI